MTNDNWIHKVCVLKAKTSIYYCIHMCFLRFLKKLAFIGPSVVKLQVDVAPPRKNIF